MTPVGNYGQLLRLDRPLISTSEAAAVWQTSGRTAGRRLEAMDEGGLVRRLRRGLWALDPEMPPFAVAPFLTAPFPAYISFWSAFARHQMIEQIPRQVSVASLDRARGSPRLSASMRSIILLPRSSAVLTAPKTAATWRHLRRLSSMRSTYDPRPALAPSFPSSHCLRVSRMGCWRNGLSGS